MRKKIISSVKTIKNGKARYSVKELIDGEWVVHREGNCGSWDSAKYRASIVASHVREGIWGV